MVEEMKPGTWVMKVAEVAQLTPEARALKVALPAGLDLKYTPGQFCMLALPRKDDPSKSIQRAYSLTSSPTRKGFLEFAFQNEGEFTHLLWELKKGDSITVKGPYGKFTFDESDSRDRGFVSGGLGITPFISAMRYASDKRLPHKLALVYSAKSDGELVYRKELEELAKQNKNLKLCFTVTRPETAPNWKGHTGRIDALFIQQSVPNWKKTVFMMCGPPGLIDACLAIFKQLNLPDDQVRREVWS